MNPEEFIASVRSYDAALSRQRLDQVRAAAFRRVGRQRLFDALMTFRAHHGLPVNARTPDDLVPDLITVLEAL